MIRHVVMWRLLPEAAGATRAENAAKLKRLFEALRGQVPGMLDLEAGINALDDPQAADLVLITTFADQAALDAYLRHPAHEAVAELMKQVRSERRVVDYAAGQATR